MRHNRDLKYAAWTGSAWRIETVDEENDVGKYASLALEANGTPHIGYQVTDAGDTPIGVKHARRATSGWQIESVAQGWQQGSHTTLALTKDGTAFIAYYDGDYRYLRMVSGLRAAAPGCHSSHE